MVEGEEQKKKKKDTGTSWLWKSTTKTIVLFSKKEIQHDREMDFQEWLLIQVQIRFIEVKIQTKLLINVLRTTEPAH